MTTRTLCGDYLLAILSPTKERPVVDSTHWKAGLAGAAIVEAVLVGALRLTEKGDPAGGGRLVPTGRASVPSDPAWAEVLERAAGQQPKGAVARIGGGSSWKDRAGDLRDAVMAELAREEIVVEREHRVLGIVPSRRWHLVQPGARDVVLARVNDTLTAAGRGPLVERDASLTGVLHASDALRKVFPEADRHWLKRQGEAVGDASWGSAAVRRAIRDVQAAVAAGAVVAAMAGASGAS